MSVIMLEKIGHAEGKGKDKIGKKHPQRVGKAVINLIRGDAKYLRSTQKDL